MLDCTVHFSRPGWIATLLLCDPLSLASCSGEVPPPAPREADVTAMNVTPKDAPAIYEFVGQTQSSREVEIRARVDEFLDKRVYTEGALVREGQILFLKDRKPFEASLQQARGELAQAQGQLHFGLINLYKALGGDWAGEAEMLAPGPAVDTGKYSPIFP
jgi:multidrug efflux pump subunit AcrA (membrane-fusion protein)